MEPEHPTPMFTEVRTQKLLELISLASLLVDVVEDFGSEDAEYYRNVINNWNPK